MTGETKEDVISHAAGIDQDLHPTEKRAATIIATIERENLNPSTPKRAVSTHLRIIYIIIKTNIIPHDRDQLDATKEILDHLAAAIEAKTRQRKAVDIEIATTRGLQVSLDHAPRILIGPPHQQEMSLKQQLITQNNRLQLKTT